MIKAEPEIEKLNNMSDIINSHSDIDVEMQRVHKKFINLKKRILSLITGK